MPPTVEEFKALLKRLNPALGVYWAPSLDLPRAAWDTAAHLYLHGGGTDEDNGELRHQLLSLVRTGHFQFKR